MPNSLLQWAHALVERLSQNDAALETMRSLLVHGYAPAMTGLSTFTAAALIAAHRPILARLRAVPARAWIAVFILFNVALALRLFWMPHMPQVYLDEISFLNTSDNLARTQLNLLSTVDEPPGPLFHPCPAGWQFLISRAYRFLGIRPEVAFSLAACLSALSVPMLFLVLFETTGRARAGLWGALFLTVLPVHLRLSGSAALETPSLFFLLATLWSIRAWHATGARTTLLVVAAAFGWFANMRMENAFALGPLLGVYLLMCAPRLPSVELAETGPGGVELAETGPGGVELAETGPGGVELAETGPRNRRADALAVAGCVVAALVFSAPALLADAYGVLTRFYFFYQSPAITEAQIASNWRGNLPYWFDNGFHPLWLTVLALVGVASAWTDRNLRRDIGFYVLWTVGLVIFYTLNPSCDFALRHTLDSWRTALQPGLGLIVLAAIGAVAATECLPRGRALASLGLVAMACATPWLFRGFILDQHMWMRQWEAMTRMRDELPKDALLLIYDHSTTLSPSSPGLAYELALTTGVTPRYFIFPETWSGKPGEAVPQIAHDVEGWKVEKRRMFLYHLDAGRLQDAVDLTKMQALLDLKPAAGVSMRANHANFTLWRIAGAAPRRDGSPARKAWR